MKKLLVAIFSLLLMIGTVNAEGKVKVYIFQAGGCPYCEAEIEYLQSLDSYNKEFEIVTKELYVDHVDWAEGADYQTGKKVAELFLSAGFEDASYKSTPFVVISNLYAAAGYNTDLESVLAAAYEAGDKDIVACVEDGGGEECLGIEVQKSNPTAGIVVAVISALALIGAIIYVFKVKKNDEEEVVKKETPKKVEAKKTTPAVKKTPAKKTTKKTKKTTKK